MPFTILIVDDDQHTRRLLETMLARDPRIAAREPRFIHAGDGAEALRLFDETPADVVITDLLMPRMDGFRFAKELRAREAGRRAGLLVVSGVYRDPAVVRQVQSELHGEFLAKPFQVKDIPDVVLRLVGEPERTESVAPPAAAALEPIDGDVATRPIPGLLLDLHEARATGVLELVRARVQKRIDLVEGYPVQVSSNQRRDMLGHFLEAKRAITHAQHQAALQRAHDGTEKLGEALIAVGALTPQQLVTHLSSQSRYKIANTLRWPDGTFRFRPAPRMAEQAKGTPIDPVAVVLVGLRRSTGLEHAERTLGVLAGRRLRLTPRGVALRPAITRIFGESLVAKLAESGALEEILALGDRAPLVVGVDVLLDAGCIASDAATDAAPFEDEANLEALFADAIPAAEVTPMVSAPNATAAGASGGEELVTVEISETNEPAFDRFDDVNSAIIDLGALGFVPQSTVSSAAQSPAAERERTRIATEYLRIQGKSWYDVLGVGRSATPAEIERAHAARVDSFALEKVAGIDLGRDYTHLEEIHSVYRQARQELLAEREAYDRRLGVRSPASTRNALGIELDFREGEVALAKGDYATAVARFDKAVAAAPDVADYHAALGWALARDSQSDDDRSRDDALARLANALAIDPDHAAAHEYAGRVLARIGGRDEEALGHLEAALGATPARLDALRPLEELRSSRGEWTRLERQYRKLIYALGQHDPETRLTLWLSLARVYQNALGDRESACTAYACALSLSPRDPAIYAALTELTASDPERLDDHLAALVGSWCVDRGDAGRGHALLRAALLAERHDLVYLVASVLEARGQGDAETKAIHRRHRPRFLVRAAAEIGPEVFAHLRHPGDDVVAGRLLALLSSVIAELLPLGLADLDVRPESILDDAALPPAFTAVRAYVAQTLGVAVPRVARQADFGDQIHLGATSPPILLAGPAALALDDKVALCFRLGRAMSFLLPGRAVGASRPATALRSILSAAVHGDNLPPGDELARRALARVKGLGEAATLADIAGKLARERRVIDLSAWVAALARTADRVGLLLAGDPVAAATAAAALSDSDTIAELLDWAISAEHAAARRALGLAVDV